MSQCEGETCTHPSHFNEDGSRNPQWSNDNLQPKKLSQEEKFLKMTNPKKWWREYGSKREK